MDETTRRNDWSYACLLAGGLLILVGGIAGSVMMATFGGMMGGYGPMTPGWIAAGWWMALVAALAGGLVLYAAYRLRRTPQDAGLAGTLGIVGGALSLLAMGGWIVGAVLSIVGGALALGSGHPASRNPPTYGP